MEVFKTDKKSLVVRAQCFPAYQLAPSPTCQLQVISSLLHLTEYFNFTASSSGSPEGVINGARSTSFLGKQKLPSVWNLQRGSGRRTEKQDKSKEQEATLRRRGWDDPRRNAFSESNECPHV
jgi:hypothetical protein